MKKVIFIDRDGVINNNSLYYTYRIEDFRINPGVFETLKVLSEKGFNFIIISNQSGISKKVYSKDQVEAVHQFMLNEFSKNDISILEIYYCTHHSDVEACLCRKPRTLLLEKSIARFKISISDSFFIGDNETDVTAALACGIKPIKIESNSDLRQVLEKLS